jgi:DNA-binding HxlR family transcriptional regulator
LQDLASREQWLGRARRALLRKIGKMKPQVGTKSKTVSMLHIGKWTVKIVSALENQPHRHRQLRRLLGNISQRMLTKNLRDLESAGLVAQRVTKSRSVAVEYSLTKMGKTFVAPLTNICQWANVYHKELSATVRLLDTEQKHS